MTNYEKIIYTEDIGNCKISLEQRVSAKTGLLYECCVLQLPNGSKRIIGKKVDYYTIRKMSKEVK